MRNGSGYKVVVNHEDQYSIWPADRETPPGWRDTGSIGSPAKCLAYVEKNVGPDTTFKLVVNEANQYSIWPADRETPPGWRDIGRVGRPVGNGGYLSQKL